MNRCLSPLVSLTGITKAWEWMDITKEFEDRSNLFKKDYVNLGAKFILSKRKTRVILISMDTDEFKPEIESLRDACETLSYRWDLRCAYVKNKEVA